MSRCAPASDAPIMARGSFQICRRASQSAAVGAGVPRVNVVRRPSAMAMSTSVSNGSLPSSSAMSPTRRPAYGAVSGVNVSTMTWSCHLAR